MNNGSSGPAWQLVLTAGPGGRTVAADPDGRTVGWVDPEGEQWRPYVGTRAYAAAQPLQPTVEGALLVIASAVGLHVDATERPGGGPA